LEVGVVRQVETAALKAASENRSAPFTRRLERLYTRGTFIDAEVGVVAGGSGIHATNGVSGECGLGLGLGLGLDRLARSGDEDSAASSYILSLCEDEEVAVGAAAGDRRAVCMSVVAIRLSTGEIVYDEFRDGVMRCELETRLEHLMPVEIVMPAEGLSEATERVVRGWAMRRGAGDGARLERVKGAGAGVEGARECVEKFYETHLKWNSNQVLKDG
jgi:DNA mismatch repair protein MSH3